VIIGKLIPAATGLKHYRTLAIEPTEPVEPPSEEGLLDEEELAAELGLEGDGAALEGFGPSFAEELEELAQEIESTTESGTSSSSSSE
jgi:DNA-directed RNA polymerase subunit beta'